MAGDGYHHHSSLFSSYTDWDESMNNGTTASDDDDAWSLRKALKTSMREILAERAHIRKRGVAMWFYNDHLIFIVAFLLLVLVIATIVIGKAVMARREKRLFELFAVKSDDSFWYRIPMPGEPVTKKTAFSPNLPKLMPSVTISTSSLSLKPTFTADTIQPPGRIEIQHQNLPKYLRPFHKDRVTQPVKAIPYSPVLFDRLTFDRPPNVLPVLRSPRPSASAPAVMSGLWARLENVLRPRKSDGPEDRELNTRRSKSQEAVPVRSRDIDRDSYRQRHLCDDCRKTTCSHINTLGVAICRSADSLGFEGVEGGQWPSYMYPSRVRCQGQSILTSLKNPLRLPKLSTFPRQASPQGTFRVVNARPAVVGGDSSDDSENEENGESTPP